MSDRPVVVTAAGAVRGRDDGRVATWRGIRYAEPPTGPLRWRAPVPAAPWGGVADAGRFAPAAPQRPNPSVPLDPGEDARMDEDCLFLNVVRPSAARRSGGARPVMVWLHGGAYALGATSQLVYHGDVLAAEGDVVIVTVGYRLGALGFLDLRTAGVEGAETNVALRDVLLALRWVRDNIRSFGGDPEAVTVFGQSAGAGLVTALLASPAGAGLFQRAIAQSPPAGSMYGPERSATVARRFVERLGAAPGRDLRGLPVETIVEAGAAVYAEIPREHPGMLAFAPVVGDDVLPEAPLRVLSEGHGLPVPLLLGTNRDEATLFRLMRSPLLPIRRVALERMFEAMRAEHERGAVRAPLPPRERVRAVYRGSRLSRGVRVATDIAFRMPALWVAAGHASVAPTYLYRFDFAPPLLRLTGIGAAHATDLPYVWGEFGGLPRDPSFLLGGRSSAVDVSERMRARWTAFARTGVPGTDWPAYDADTRRTLVIGREDTLASDLDAALRAGWGEQVLAFG